MAFPPAAAGFAVAAQVTVDSGSTAWMLASSALVLLMVPGLALFYGGMVRRKNILTTMMHSFVAMAVIGVHWVGGMWGAMATGVFCFTPVAGLILGAPGQVLRQLVGVLATIAFAGAGTWMIGTLLRATVGLRVTEAQERDGLDITVHGEHGYHL